MEDEDTPFRVTKTDIQCPRCEKRLPVELGWVNPEGPVLHINCPELVVHLHSDHRDLFKEDE
jgi:hypothetical protein